jgi:glucosamine kinase
VAYYLGIDGGGSKTTCAIGDERSLLASVETGPSNVTRVGEALARESLHQAIREACNTAKIAPSELLRSCIGVAGAGRENVAAIIRTIVAEVIPGEVEVVGDMPIALEAAFSQGPGVIVIAGTGSFAYGRGQQGKTARAGGWGFAISDEGSAHWIGLRAVREAVREADKSATTPALLELLMQVRQNRSFDEFVHAANADPDFATFFPVVTKMASSGDPIARQVLTEAGVELANLAEIVISKLFANDAAVPLAMAGGVFRHSSLVREVFYNQVCKVRGGVALHQEIIEPVLGALRMARKHI